METSLSSSSDVVPIRKPSGSSSPSSSSSSAAAAASASTSTPDRISDAEIETIVRAIRSRYIEGLQVMLQKQCEVGVETFKVSPIICGMMPSIWLRYVVCTGVYADGWVPSVVASCQDLLAKRAYASKRRLVEERAAIHFVNRTLHKLIPIYSTLAITFLSCHLAREPVLPTDIIDWALEAKLPYLSFFVEMDKYIGTASSDCQLKNKTMFRPALLLGSWKLEATVGKIAKKIGLHLPPVNFYAVTRRWLEELSLPMEIVSYACRVHEWLSPAEMWISDSCYGFPTRVVVMSILIITLRILYNINGGGTWEKNLCGVTDKQAEDVCEMQSSACSGFDAKELLRVLEAVHKDIEVKHDYSKDLNSYIKYCKDVICAGVIQNPKLHLKRAIKMCWNIFDKNEDSDLRLNKMNRGNPSTNEKRCIDDITSSFEPSAPLKPDSCKRKCLSHNFVVDSSLRKERELDKMMFEMDENCFFYRPPVTRMKAKGYITYRRSKRAKNYVYAVYADYYILLRALAKVARVDMRLLHACSLELERKLAWIEENIITSLNVPKLEGGPIERHEIEPELD